MSTASLGVHCIQDTLKEDMELEQQLNLINKPSIKVIQVFYNFLFKLPYTLFVKSNHII